MAAKSVPHCAKQFAEQWFGREAPMCADLASRDRARSLHALQSGAGHFRIARNFPTDFDLGKGLQRLEPILTALEPFRDVPMTSETLLSTIGSLRQHLGAIYGGRDRLSAATKFLWLLRRDPVIIYDSQARIALRAPSGDYGEYLRLWHTGFTEHQTAISAACLALPMSGPRRLSPNDATQSWFHQRVYDIYLWNLGSPT